MKYFIYTLLTIIITTSCTKKTSKLNQFKGETFGTYYIIKTEKNGTEKQLLQKGIDSVINKINQSLNTYIPTSDISKINKGDSTIVVDHMFKEVYQLSDKVNKESDGYFDPTIGILRNAYGFGDTKPINNISDLQLDSLMKFVGWKKVSLSSEGKINKKHPEIYFDFNATAKGYAIDRIVTYLASKGIKNLSVEIGGEVRVLGENIEKNAPWSIGIEKVGSKSTNRTVREIIVLKNKSIAGSGNFRKNRTDPINGKKYVHTINPITGKAEQGNVLSSYVIANTCAEADAYATTFMAMGIEKSEELLSKLHDIEAYLVYAENNGKIKTYVTAGFRNMIKQ